MTEAPKPPNGTDDVRPPSGGRTVPADGFRTFLHVLVNTAIANVTTSFLWFGLTFWVYVETRNVIATGVIGASYMLFISMFGMFFGTLVDRFRKHAVMVWATVIALAVFVLDAAFFFAVGQERILDLSLPWFWIFAVVMLAGSVVEQLRGIALSTTVTLLVPAERHANANGMVGAVQGVAMLVTSVFSGLSVGFLGMGWTLVIGIGALALTLLHLVPLRIPEEATAESASIEGLVDLRGGWLAVRAVPGLIALVLFTSLNNLRRGCDGDHGPVRHRPVRGAGLGLLVRRGLDRFHHRRGGRREAGHREEPDPHHPVRGHRPRRGGRGLHPPRARLAVHPRRLAVHGADAGRRGRRADRHPTCGALREAGPRVRVRDDVRSRRRAGHRAAHCPDRRAVRTDAAQRQWEWLLGTGEARGIALILLVGGVCVAAFACAALLSPQYRRLSSRYRAAAEQTEAEAREQVPV
jgi:hypothetical protein